MSHNGGALRHTHEVELTGVVGLIPRKGRSPTNVCVRDPTPPHVLSAPTDLLELEDAETVLLLTVR